MTNEKREMPSSQYYILFPIYLKKSNYTFNLHTTSTPESVAFSLMIHTLIKMIQYDVLDWKSVSALLDKKRTKNHHS